MKNTKAFIAYLVVFFAAWGGYVLFAYPSVVRLGDTTLSYLVANTLIRLLLWVIPVFVFLKYIERVEDVLGYLQLKQHLARGIGMGCGVGVLLFIGHTLIAGWPKSEHLYFTWNSIVSTSLLIGVIEEIPFRGFILKKFQERFDFWIANGITSFLFLAIHLTGWISLGLFSWSVAAAVLITGFLLGILTYYARSLWAPIIAHDVNNLISAVLYHLPS